MRKLSFIFSFLFIFLVAPAVTGFNDAKADFCSGNVRACADRTISECTNGGGCALNTAGDACSGTPTNTSCAGLTRLACNDTPGCRFTSTADADDNALVDTLCNALKIVTGNGGKAFAAFAIISVGIGFFTGKVSWGLMIGVTAGIAAMFGAPTIVAAIAGGDAFDCGS